MAKIIQKIERGTLLEEKNCRKKRSLNVEKNWTLWSRSALYVTRMYVQSKDCSLKNGIIFHQKPLLLHSETHRKFFPKKRRDFSFYAHTNILSLLLLFIIYQHSHASHCDVLFSIWWELKCLCCRVFRVGSVPGGGCLGQGARLSHQAETQGTHRRPAHSQGHPHRGTQTQTAGTLFSLDFNSLHGFQFTTVQYCD